MKDTFVNYIGHEKRVMFQKYDTDENGIALLLKLMETEPLDPRQADTLGYKPEWIHPDSDHAKSREGMQSYLGNFHRVSCVFSIDTSDPELIARLDAAIHKNLASPEYQAANSRRKKPPRTKEAPGVIGKHTAAAVQEEKKQGQQRTLF